MMRAIALLITGSGTTAAIVAAPVAMFGDVRLSGPAIPRAGPVYCFVGMERNGRFILA